MVKASDIILILVAILFPPAAAFFIAGCGCDLLINICLTVLGYIPGHIHAFYLIYKKISAEERFGPGGYTYVGNGQFIAADGSLPTGTTHGQYGAVNQGY